MRNRSPSGSELVVLSFLVACGLLSTGCPKKQDTGASAEAEASARSAAAAPKDEDDDKADERDDEKDDEKEKDKGGW